MGLAGAEKKFRRSLLPFPKEEERAEEESREQDAWLHRGISGRSDDALIFFNVVFSAVVGWDGAVVAATAAAEEEEEKEEEEEEQEKEDACDDDDVLAVVGMLGEDWGRVGAIGA